MTLVWKKWELGAVGVLLAFGAWLRLPHLERGITGDETGLLQFRGWDWILRDSLNVLHPPLYRMCFRAMYGPTDAVVAGRWWSFGCGLLTIALVVVLARRLSQNRVAGLIAGGLLAGLPAAITWSAFHRPYAMLGLLMAAHIWSLARWAEASAGRWVPVLVMFTALLMPQVHYLAVPWLLLTGVSVVLVLRMPWRRTLVYLPAAAAFVPLIPMLLDPPARGGPLRRAGDLPAAWEWLMSMGVAAPEFFPGTVAWQTAGGLLLTAVAWRGADRGTRVTLLGALSLMATVLVSSSQHAMTSSTKLLGAPLFIPLLVALPFLLQRHFPRARKVIWVLAVWMLIAAVRMGYTRHVDELLQAKPEDRMGSFLADWKDHVPTGHRVEFVHSSNINIAKLVLKDALRSSVTDEGCGEDRRCFVHGGHRWGVADLSNLHPGPSTLIWTRSKPRDPLPSRCALVETSEALPWIAQCAASLP